MIIRCKPARLISFLIIVLASTHCRQPQPSSKADGTDEINSFMKSLAELCDKEIRVFMINSDQNVIGERISIAAVWETCNRNEFRIALKLKENETVHLALTLVGDDLLLKHDVRTDDLAPAEFTMYGGFASPTGTPVRQSFPIHNFGSHLWPGYESYSWELSLETPAGPLHYFEKNDESIQKHLIIVFISSPEE